LSYLTITTADGRSFQRVIDKDILTVGRSSKNDINLTLDGSLSRIHAEFSRQGAQIMVRDVGSRNGTSLNGVPVVKSTPMKPGDRITLGETTIIYGEGLSTEVVIEDTPVGQETTTYTMSVDEIITQSNVFTISGEESTQHKQQLTQAAIADSDQAGRTLAVLSRAGMELINDRPYGEILNTIMDLVFEAIKAERGFLMLMEGDSGEMVNKTVRDLTKNSAGSISLSKSIANMVVKNRQSVLTRDAQSDERFKMRESVVLQGIRSAMCVPLWNNKEVIGLIYVDSVSAISSFDREDLKLLTLLANIAAVKLENSRLAMDAVEDAVEKEKIEQELEQAADIQKRLLPMSAPEIPGYDLSGRADSCRSVGGDYFDYVVLSNANVGLVLGDVSGKGMAAALLMASVQAIFRTLADVQDSAKGLIKTLNHQVIRNANPNKFCSLFYGQLTPATGEMTYVNAGHNPPIILRASGESEELPACGVVLGVFEDAKYEEKKTQLNPGDILAIFSDGVTEAQDTEGNMFTEERFLAAMKKHQDKSAPDIIKAIFDDVVSFAGKEPQYDDSTLMILKRRA
jgi:sigma-B regulation protein RsbU (phosphoserine phosphatase)